MAKNIDSDFNFEDYFEVDEEDNVKADFTGTVEGIVNDEEAYDRMIDLHEDIKSIGIDAEYPCLLVRGFSINDEIRFMAERLVNYAEMLSESDKIGCLPIIFDICNTKRKIIELPLTLDTILKIISVYEYDIYLVQEKNNEIKLDGNMLKALMFT